jgi:hypothetical protein
LKCSCFWVCFPTFCPKPSVDNESVAYVIPNQWVTTVAPGLWACVRRGQPNEEFDCENKCRCQEYPNNGRDSQKWHGVAEGATSTPVMETSKALEYLFTQRASFETAK